ncbi:hypothetical protein [Sporosarcina sp. 6E9]|uniref:hypothetical protein n=1 Tax=Sporosarcina sp. 6E9 TaxID=2819235 RepID=UPI001B315A81|nr:hypothetical protein [Sporosarcina sp. 6E9]
MKKFSMLLLIAILALSACGVKLNDGDEKEVEAQEITKEKSEVKENEESESDSTEKDEKDNEDSSIVEIIFPASFYEGMDSDEVIANLNAEGMDDVTANDDGSYTIKMSKERHVSYLQELRDDIDSDLQGMVEMMEIESITEIAMNEDVTELTVSINQDLYDEYMNGLVLMDFALYASMFQMMNGVSEADFDFQVVLVDDKTGEEFKRTSVYDE